MTTVYATPDLEGIKALNARQAAPPASSYVAPVAAPGPLGIPDPTTGAQSATSPDTQRYSRVNPGTTIDQGKIDQATALTTDVTPFDETARRKQMIDAQAERFSSLDRIYDAKAADERRIGEKYAGRTNAIAAMTGGSGTPDATSGLAKNDRATQDRVNLVNEERALKIAQIYDRIDENLIAEKEAARATQRENAKNLLSKVASNASELLKGLASQGVPWDTFKAEDPETFGALIKQTGQSEYALRSQYDEALPEEFRPVKYVDYKDDGKGGTIMTKVTFDPKTKKTSVDNYGIAAPLSMFAGAEKPIEVGGKLLVKQADGTYKDMTPRTQAELDADAADLVYKKSQAEKNYADAAKARAEAAATKIGDGLSDKDRAAFNGITAKYNASPLIKSADKMSGYLTTIENAGKGQPSAQKDLNLIYAYIKALDYGESAVREGEIDLGLNTGTLRQQAEGLYNKLIANNGMMAQDQRNNYVLAARQLISSVNDAAKNKEKTFSAQAKQNGEAVYKAWDQFMKDSSPSYRQNAPGSRVLIDPSTQQPMDASDLTEEEYQQAVNDGYVPQE